MTRFAPALFSLFLALILGLSACGVERDSPVALDAESDPDQTSTDDGGDQADGDVESGGDEETTTPTTVAPEPTPTPSTAPPDEVAIVADFVDGDTWELTHGELNSVVIPTWENEEFVANAFGGVVPPNFYSGVLGEHLVAEVIQRELDGLGASVDPAAIEAAESNILGLVQNWYLDSPDPEADAAELVAEVPYLQFITDFQAGQQSLLAAIAAGGESTVEAPCVRHILVETEDEAQQVLDDLNDGADFATLAAERSVGPTGPTGGDLGCAPSTNYVPEFAGAVDSAELGAFVGPVQTQFGWHVLVVDRYEETDTDPTPVANQLITDALAGATIEVDPRIGSWDPSTLTVVPAQDQGADDTDDQ